MPYQPETEFHVVAFLDGRPGHEKQTLGIVQALQEIVRVRITHVTLKKQSLFDTLLHSCALFVPGVRFGGAMPQADDAHLLIGTGSHTHLPMLLAKKRTGIPVVTCMSPARHLRNLFDLCFIPEHDGLREAVNIVHTAGAPNMSKNRGMHESNQGLILFGGIDEKSHHWDGKKIVAMVEELIQNDDRFCWTLSSSPRTPDDTVNLLKKLDEKYPKIQFFDYRDTPDGWVEKQYDRCGVVWVTSDSISMIYEALSAGCQVGILPMIWKRENCKFRRNEAMLVSRGLVRPFSGLEQPGDGREDTGGLNEAQRCARIIVEKWWPNSLQ
jgi:mitochondrial fission protein ELM1